MHSDITISCVTHLVEVGNFRVCHIAVTLIVLAAPCQMKRLVSFAQSLNRREEALTVAMKVVRFKLASDLRLASNGKGMDALRQAEGRL